MGNLPAGLRGQLLVTHLLVGVVGAAAVLLTTELIAPQFFVAHLQAMAALNAPPGGGNWPGATAGVQQADDFLHAAFRTSVTEAVLVAAGVAGVAAVLASLLLSTRIVQPIRRIAAASHRIAAGHYTERVAQAAGGPTDELDQLAGSFNTMAAALEATERRRVELLGDVAHELRTPISVLEGTLEGLLDRVITPSPETWAHLHDETGRLHRLVDDLRDLSRAEARQMDLTLAAVEPAALVRAAVDRLGLAFAEKGVALVIRVPHPLPRVYADHDRVVQVLTNLLTNALRYTPAGGQVTVAGDHLTPKRVLRFAVADTGVGISAEHLPYVFERFYRVDKSRSRHSGGSGVGLTIARTLVEAMGGRITAHSAGPGQGSTFTFTLPVAAPAGNLDPARRCRSDLDLDPILTDSHIES